MATAQAYTEAAFAELVPLEQVLTELPAGQWTADMVEAYLRAALKVVDSQLGCVSYAYNDLPWSLEDLTRRPAYIARWPGNPLADWRPIAVLAPSDGFSPGDVVLQVPPGEFYSVFEEWPRCSSYELAIYGAAEETAPAAAMAEGNAPWAQVLPGTLAQVGRHFAPLKDAVLPAEQRTTFLDAANADARKRQQAVAYFRSQLAGIPRGTNQRIGWGLSSLGDMLEVSEKAEASRKVLLDKPPAQWTDAEILDYQHNSLFAIYMALQAYKWLDFGELEQTSQLADLGLPPAWPANPYEGWRPVQVLKAGDPFSAGDLVLIEAPVTDWRLGRDGPRSPSYELCVYGSSPEATAESLNPRMEYMADWPPAPAGIVGRLTTFSESQLSSEFDRAICHS